ncbi:hypothetical protein BD311DRAFT_659851 [Dichomitus squalens]|uniref:Uncharacterized protein n=1 Tax=Dichomitus squalens TaxID=114155 RepID=A0A4Q9MQS2_9APHY|nr:hypothetical protein BD311DRAFT_659851 [Dichomitus squalens]
MAFRVVTQGQGGARPSPEEARPRPIRNILLILPTIFHRAILPYEEYMRHSHLRDPPPKAAAPDGFRPPPLTTVPKPSPLTVSHASEYLLHAAIVVAASSNVTVLVLAQPASATERNAYTIHCRRDGDRTKSHASALLLVCRGLVGPGLARMGAMIPTTSTMAQVLGLRDKPDRIDIRTVQWR